MPATEALSEKKDEGALHGRSPRRFGSVIRPVVARHNRLALVAKKHGNHRIECCGLRQLVDGKLVFADRANPLAVVTLFIEGAGSWIWPSGRAQHTLVLRVPVAMQMVQNSVARLKEDGKTENPKQPEGDMFLEGGQLPCCFLQVAQVPLISTSVAKS